MHKYYVNRTDIVLKLKNVNTCLSLTVCEREAVIVVEGVAEREPYNLHPH